MSYFPGCGYDGSEWHDPFDVGGLSDAQVRVFYERKCIVLPLRDVKLIRWDFCSVDPTRLLLTFNVSVNLGDKYHKNTSLHWAVLAGNTTVITLLLEANANVDAQNIKVKSYTSILKSSVLFIISISQEVFFLATKCWRQNFSSPSLSI